MHGENAVSGVWCLLWGADLWLRPSWWMSGCQEDLVSNWGPAHILVEDAVSGAKTAPLPRALAIAPSASASASSGLWAGLQPASSPLVMAQPFVL